MNLKQMMQQHEAREAEEHREQDKVVTDLLQKLSEVRSMIEETEGKRRRDEAQNIIEGEGGHVLPITPSENETNEVEIVNEVREESLWGMLCKTLN